MFRHCRGFGRRKSGDKDDDDSTSSSEYELDRASMQDGASSVKELLTETFVLEVVGALGLQGLADDVDSFCTIAKVSSSGTSTVIHRTKTIPHDTAPIWTLKTKSTCLVDMCKANPTEQLQIELCHKTLGIPGVSDIEIVGRVTLNYSTLLAHGDSTRREYPLAKEKYPGILLALRFRKASPEDSKIYNELQNDQKKEILPESFAAITEALQRSSREDGAGDIDFEHVTTKPLVGNCTTVVENDTEVRAYRVWPFPDPDNPKETTFMTKAKIHHVAMEPSRNWVEATGGSADNYGSVFLEVIGCSDLPNMDVELINGLTDAFVACVYEDNFVRTPIIHDSLNPRWMPWSQRAFEFHIQHPSSILYLGVFDYDESPVERHDPVGRVVIVPSHFEKDTMYTLQYPLHYEDEDRGTLTVRLRIHWHNEADASKAESFVRPPRFIINVRTTKAWKVLRYLTRGETDMTEVTIKSVKLYATELKEHWLRYCYLLDTLGHLFLWRGRIPIHSFVFFVGLLMAIDVPRFAPSIIIYLAAYALLGNNYSLCNHPSPWSRVRSFASVALNHHFPSDRRVVIEPNVCAEEGERQDRLDEYKGLRVSAFLHKAMKTALGVYRVYRKSTPLDISTVSKSGNIISKLYVDYLYYAHLLLRMMCTYIRLLRNFVNWRSGSTYKLTIDLLMIATAWVLFPYKQMVVKMVMRIVVVAILGPQNRVIDELWIRPYYRTNEDLLRDGIPATTEEMKTDIWSRPNILDQILVSKWVYDMGKSGRIVVEENLKLQAARELHYGKFSESVPTADSSRYPSVPTPFSFAQPYTSPGDLDSTLKKVDGTYLDILPNRKVWSTVPSQKLRGNILPQPAIDVLMLPSEITL